MTVSCYPVSGVNSNSIEARTRGASELYECTECWSRIVVSGRPNIHEVCDQCVPINFSPVLNIVSLNVKQCPFPCGIVRIPGSDISDHFHILGLHSVRVLQYGRCQP